MNTVFTLRPALDADLPRMVAIFNAQAYLPTTLEEFRRIEENRRPEDPFLRLVAVAADGAVAGFGNVGTGPGVKPGEYDINVRVDGPSQGAGAGRALYAALEAWAVERGAAALKSAVNETNPDALDWAGRRGYEKEYHLFKSALDLGAWDAAPFAGAVEAALAAGLCFTDFAAEAESGEESYRRLYDLIGELMDDMPGAAGRVRAPYGRWRENIDKDPRWDPRGLVLAADGKRWVAMAAITRLPSGDLYNGFTGVGRAYRGRGLGLAVKVVALRYARSLGVACIRTSNHSVNAPMLAINQKLGYVPAPGTFTLIKRIG